jgi:predicted nucleic acid-binding protein
MILSDTDILSALAKVGQFELLYPLFAVDQLYIVPSVFQELYIARQKQYNFAATIFRYIEVQHIVEVMLTPVEAAFAHQLPDTLGAGERESVAVAHQRNGILLCNESRAKHWCRQLNIEYFDIPLLLRVFWTSGNLTQNDVRQLIVDLYEHDRMRLSAASIDAIFAPIT